MPTIGSYVIRIYGLTYYIIIGVDMFLDEFLQQHLISLYLAFEGLFSLRGSLLLPLPLKANRKESEAYGNKN